MGILFRANELHSFQPQRLYNEMDDKQSTAGTKKSATQREQLKERRQQQIGDYKRLVQQEERLERRRKRRLIGPEEETKSPSSLPRKKRVSFVESSLEHSDEGTKT